MKLSYLVLVVAVGAAAAQQPKPNPWCMEQPSGHTLPNQSKASCAAQGDDWWTYAHRKWSVAYGDPNKRKPVAPPVKEKKPDSIFTCNADHPCLVTGTTSVLSNTDIHGCALSFSWDEGTK